MISPPKLEWHRLSACTAVRESVCIIISSLLVSQLLQEMAQMERTRTPMEGVDPTSFIAKLK